MKIYRALRDCEFLKIAELFSMFPVNSGIPQLAGTGINPFHFRFRQ